MADQGEKRLVTHLLLPGRSVTSCCGLRAADLPADDIAASDRSDCMAKVERKGHG